MDLDDIDWQIDFGIAIGALSRFANLVYVGIDFRPHGSSMMPTSTWDSAPVSPSPAEPRTPTAGAPRP
jgi:hypothetical protein